MSACDAILKDGIFNQLQVSDERSSAETYLEWLKSSTFQQISEAQEKGLKIVLPIKGIPLEYDGKITETQFKEWKQQISTGTLRELTTSEIKLIAEKSADSGVVAAWKDCILSTAFGLLDYEEIADDGVFSVTLRYSPNAVEDEPPTVTGFSVQGATCSNQVMDGASIPYAGVTLLFSRSKDANGNYPAAAYVINTTKGTAQGKIPAVNTRQTPRIHGLHYFSAVGSTGSWPTAEVTVPPDYKMIGGGARVNWTGNGSLLTASYPAKSDTWRAAAKDHVVSSQANIDVWAVAIHDPNDEFEVVIDTAQSVPAHHPSASVSPRDGFQLVGGGADAHWNVHGQLLTASYPVGKGAWFASSKDHQLSEVNTITTYVISMRPRNGAPVIPIEVREVRIDRASHPEGAATVPDGCKLIGGGARIDWTGNGNLLTASYPTETSWVGKAKDHDVADPAPMSVYAIGIRDDFFA